MKKTTLEKNLLALSICRDLFGKQNPSGYLKEARLDEIVDTIEYMVKYLEQVKDCVESLYDRM